MVKDSLFSNNPECYICHDTRVTHVHHIYGASNRQISEREGCWVYLCPYHHNMSDFGVHFDKKLNLDLKQECQRRWMVREGKSTEDFRMLFGRSYL